MINKQLFEEMITLKIWDHFFKSLERTLRPLEETQKQEIRLELQDHLYASFQQEKKESEPERLMDAIERLGDPEYFLKPLLTDKLLTKAIKSLNPKTIFKALYFYLLGGLRNIAYSLLFFFGYFLSLLFLLMAVFKPIIPGHTGIIKFNDGGFIVGFSTNNSGIASDPLGYWIIPIGLILSALIYIGMTKLLRILKKRKK